METKPVEFNDQKIACTVTFRVFRYAGDEAGQPPRYQEYQVPVLQGMTILEGLIYIKQHLDTTLAWRASCRMGVCGSCGMFINGKPLLACQQQILKMHTSLFVIAPLPNYHTIRDLVPDFTRLFKAHQAIRPYIIRKGQPVEQIAGELYQTPDELVRYLQFSYCLKCGLCMSACPTVGSLPAFPGPQPLGQALRYVYDTRDDGFEERREAIDHPEGIFRCHFAGACSEACPKGIDPAFAIQLLKGEIVKRSVFGKKVPPPAPAMDLKQENPKKLEKIPAPPPRSVE